MALTGPRDASRRTIFPDWGGAAIAGGKSIGDEPPNGLRFIESLE
jgi:hypothetical protein